MTRNSSTYYFTSDVLGSVSELTDSGQNIAEAYKYDSFGNLQIPPTTGNPYTYISREYDSETGLYYYRMRYYDSTIGRFITADPIGFLGGENFYSYVLNNPINFFDPVGLKGGPWHPPENIHTKCLNSDDCPQIKGKIWVLDRMLMSHQGWDQHMPSPRGGGRHVEEIAQLWVQLAECQSLYEKKGCDKKCSSEPKESPSLKPKLQFRKPLWWLPLLPFLTPWPDPY